MHDSVTFTHGTGTAAERSEVVFWDILCVAGTAHTLSIYADYITRVVVL